ncbi:MAG: thiolase domain-containing protein [Spirochaetia bacterium]|nr:thiolase domain-containing protein [Spirochaetia bacterium]
MSMRPLMLGGAQTDFAINWSKTTGFVGALADVIHKGLSDSGIGLQTVRKLIQENRIAAFIGNFNAPLFLTQGHLGAFLSEVDPAFNGIPSARYENACASGSVAIDTAAARIRAGDYDVALVIGVEIMKTKGPAEANDCLSLAADYAGEAKSVRFYFPRAFGTIAEEVIARGGPSEQTIMDSLSEISRVNYANAKENSLAQTRAQELDMQMLNKRFGKSFGERTRYSDCSQVTDGAAMIVLARPGFAKGQAELAGFGHRTASISLKNKLDSMRSDPQMFPLTFQAIQECYARAAVNVDQIDVFETHDCFTISEYLAISAFGITKPGEEFKAIESGSIQKKGKTPINPSGGLIGAGHPVGASGVRMALDLYKQVTDKAEGTQVSGAKTGAMLNIGGSFASNYSFVIRRVAE